MRVGCELRMIQQFAMTVRPGSYLGWFGRARSQIFPDVVHTVNACNEALPWCMIVVVCLAGVSRTYGPRPFLAGAVCPECFGVCLFRSSTIVLMGEERPQKWVLQTSTSVQLRVPTSTVDV